MPQTRTELVRLSVIVLVASLGIGATFLVPTLDRYRPWVQGEPLPLSVLFKRWGEGVPKATAAGTIEGPINSATAAAIAELDSAQAAVPPPSAGRSSSPPALRVAPEEYAGIEIEIENAATGLSFFHRELLKTAKREEHAVTRLAHWGDSSIATDLITFTMRRKLQQRFGDAGHGFILMARGFLPYRHRDVMWRSNDAWELRQLVANQDPREGMYGYGGVQYRAQPGAFSEFGTSTEGPVGGRVSRFEVYFQRSRAGGGFSYSVDRGESVSVSAQGTDREGFELIEMPDGPHSLAVRATAGTRLYGVVLERDRPGIVYDSLGMVGARARRILNYDEAHVSAQIGRRDPDLIILGFGGNEADDPVSRTRYEEEFYQVIRRMRAGKPQASCLVFAPLDQGERDERGTVVTMAPVPTIVEAQRAAARRGGCGFYNTFEAMGGPGSMAAWSRSRPRLAMSDYRHATPEGYEVIATLFHKAMLKSFAEFLERSGEQ